MLAEEGRPSGSFVRVGVKGGGCSGLMYQLDFDHVMNDDDQSFEDNGVKVVVDKKSFLYSWARNCATVEGSTARGLISQSQRQSNLRLRREFFTLTTDNHGVRRRRQDSGGSHREGV